jgi:hypothetical protein
MKLPQHVKKLKAHLEKVKDSRLATLRLLTETENPAYKRDIEHIWGSLFTAEKDCNAELNSEWALEFLDAVHSFMQEKRYFSLPGAERRESITKIKKHTRELKKAYKKLGLDQPFLLYDPATFPLPDEDGAPITDTHFLPAIGITEALDFYRDYANEEIKRYNPRGKIGIRHQSNRFVALLGKRFVNMYKKPLWDVLASAALLLYDEQYSHSEILYHVNGRRK